MKKALLVVIVLVVAVTVTTVYALSATLTARPTLIKNGNQTTFIAYANGTDNVPESSVLAKRVSSEGWRLELYLPTAAKKGDSVILYTIIQKENISTEVSIDSGLITITDSNGSTVYQAPFARTCYGGNVDKGALWHVTAA